MDIRFINGRNEIINASKLSIKAMNNFLIGIDAGKNVVEIEKYESGEEVKEILKGIAELLSGDNVVGLEAVMIDLRKGEEERK